VCLSHPCVYQYWPENCCQSGGPKNRLDRFDKEISGFGRGNRCYILSLFFNIKEDLFFRFIEFLTYLVLFILVDGLVSLLVNVKTNFLLGLINFSRLLHQIEDCILSH
jgi:hypothetical protein